MTLIIEENGHKGKSVATENGQLAGEMHYTWAGPGKLIIDHTEVNPDFAGRGIGKLLLMELVKMAREKKIKILPLCPFAKSVFEKNPEINDTLF
ncbi:MAG: N-acetyltransferase [Bacteroidia bacterium]|nr:N-acetyltransferase [Bacteroidia bacterium]